MSFLPTPLDNIYVLIAVVIGLVLLVFAFNHSRKVKKQLEQTRANKEAARKARLKAKRDAADASNE
ncbi:hypothetical protein [Fretibacter rubidus]|uniref:hypothetical protein n=1 Tax=Fretibacter rubidus TaxID=570162 RepID=UPI00352A02C2